MLAMNGTLVWLYGGPLNEVTRMLTDERVVRAAAQADLDAALHSDAWEQTAERRFETPMHFEDFADFEQRMMCPTFADHRVDDAKLAAAHAVCEPPVGRDGAPLTRWPVKSCRRDRSFAAVKATAWSC